MITLGELDPDSLPTQAEVDAAPRPAKDTAEILAGMPAHLRAQMLGISPAMQMFAQMQNSAAMRIAADIPQSSVMKVARIVAQMQVTMAPIRQALAEMHAALAVTKAATHWSQAFEVVRALRAALPAPVATVVVDDFLRLWLIKLSALVPGYLRAQTMPRSVPPRGPMKARAPGALRMILLIDIRRGCATA